MTPPAKRYFYTDPLAAAWMSEHFGMAFVNDLPDDRGWCFQVIGMSATADTYKIAFSVNSPPRAYKFYVHPDSLRLLEPQVEDLCESSNGVAEICEAGVSDTEIGGNVLKVIVVDGFFRLRSDVKKIVQRNGLAFHWPESEDA